MDLIPYAAAIVACLGGVVAFLFKQVLAGKDKSIKDLEDRLKTYQDLAAEAIKSAVDTANHYRAKENKPPLIPVAPVIAEGSSVPSDAQQSAAKLATFRATLAAVKLAMGQPARPEPGAD